MESNTVIQSYHSYHPLSFSIRDNVKKIPHLFISYRDLPATYPRLTRELAVLFDFLEKRECKDVFLSYVTKSCKYKINMNPGCLVLETC